MKISKLFHWLYASVMMLPLIVAPIFAIYTHRHNVDQDTSVVEQVPVYYDSIQVNGDSDIISGYLYLWVDSLQTYNTGASYTLLELSYNSLDPTCNKIWHSTDNNIYLTNLVNKFINVNSVEFYLVVDTYHPSISYPNFYTALSYTDFQLFKDYRDVVTTYPNDVGTTFINNVFITLDKYFNVTNFIGLNNLYAWINTNVFNGVAPLGFNIFYMLLSYWLLVSIFWLVFDVVMYVPNLAHRWLDKGSLQ